jgi:ankyrin repeat protein
VKTLIDVGAGLNIKDKQGITALKYAENIGDKDIITLLEKARARK